MPSYPTLEQLAPDLALRDLTDPETGPHAIQLLVDAAAGALSDAWGCVQRPSPGPRVVVIADNYDNLAFTVDAASRDARYTRYVDEYRMLRSHASAMVLRPFEPWPPSPSMTSCWCAPASCFGETPSIACTPVLPISSTCGASRGTRSATRPWTR